MNLDECRLLIPQYFSGDLDAAQISDFEQQLETSAELRAEVAELRPIWDALEFLPLERPSPALRARFYQRLHALTATVTEASRPPRKARWVLAPFQQIALSVLLLLLGLFIGHALDRSQSSEDVAQLRGEIRAMRQTVALSLLEGQSAEARLQGVSWGSRVDHPDRDVQTALLTALNHDANVNVRLSSVDALTKFASDPAIRRALLDSIATQESPLIQIALIDALVQVRDAAVIPELRRLALDPQFNPNVRERARWGVQKLAIQ